MKPTRSFLTLLLASGLALAAAPDFVAAFPARLPFTATILTTQNVPVPDGTYRVVVRIYNQPEGGSPIWQEEHVKSTVDGRFSVFLGEITPLTPLDYNQSLYVGIEIGTDGEMKPRRKMGTVPQALVSQKATGLIAASADSAIDIEGKTNIRGELTVLEGLSVAKGARIDGSLQFGSNATLTNQSGGIGFNLPLLPTTGGLSLGSASQRWGKIFVDEIDATAFSVDSTTSSIFSLNIDAADDEAMALRFYRGGGTAAALSWDPTTQRFDLYANSTTEQLANLRLSQLDLVQPLAVTAGGTGIASSPAEGQLLIGKTDGSYALATLTAGANVHVVNGDGTITISADTGDGGQSALTFNEGAGSFTVTGGTGTEKTLTVTENTLLNQNLGTANSPTFAGLTLTGLTGVLKGSSGAITGSATTSDLTEGANLYFTAARVADHADVAANTAARHSALTLGTSSGLVLNGQQLSLQLASSTQPGALSAVDWSTFNNKQAAGSYIASLSGDVTAVGPGAAVASLTDGAVTLSKMADMATASFLGRATTGVGRPEVLSISNVRSLLDITNIENLALSSWEGSANLVTVGTITSGTWAGTAIGDDYILSAPTWNAKQDALTFGNVTGTSNQVTVSGGTGAVVGNGVTLALPQDIHTEATPSFASLSLSAQSGLSLLPFGAGGGQTSELRFRELAANGSHYVGFKSPDSLAGSLVWTLPDADGSADQILVTNGAGQLAWADISGSGGLAASPSASYVTIGTESGLTGERVLTGTANQITISDAGANGAVTLALAQDIHTSATPSFGSLSLNSELRFRELAANGSHYVGFKSPDALDGNLVWTLPGADGSADQILVTNGAGQLAWADISGSGGLAASPSASYLTIGSETGLSGERSLAGTANQIILSDGGANNTLTLSLPQNIHTAATPTFVGLTLSGLSASSALFTDAAKGLTSTGKVAIGQGGTGLDIAPTTGQLLIGKTDGSYALATLTAGTNVTITESDGGITINANENAATGITSLGLAADSGTPEALGEGDTLTIAGGNGLTSSVTSPNTVTLAVDYNDTNLKITSDQLNTVQDISTTATPQFGRIGLGTAAGTARLTLAAATTAAGGLDFGGDTNLYRSSANSLRTDDSFTAGGDVSVVGNANAFSELRFRVGGEQATPLYDDFSDNNYTADPAWTTPTGTWTAASGYLAVNNGNYYAYTAASTTFDQALDIRFKYKITTFDNPGLQVFFGSSNTTGDQYYYAVEDVGNYNWRNALKVGDTYLAQQTGGGSLTDWYNIRITRTTDGYWRLYINSTLIGSPVQNTTYNNGSYFVIKVYNGSGSATAKIIDDISITQGNSNYVGFKAPTELNQTAVWSLPNGEGQAGQYLKTDGNGSLGWGNIGSMGLGSSAPTTQLSVGGILPTAATGAVAAGGTNPYYVTAQNNLAYVLNRGSNSLTVVDVSRPTAPQVLSSTATGGEPVYAHVTGKHLYVCNYGGNSLQIFDVSNPYAPTLLSTITIGGANGVYVQGSYAYVAGYWDGKMYIVDISNPVTPTVVSSVSTGTQPHGVTVYGRYAYVANWYQSQSVSIVDIANPYKPVKVSDISTADRPRIAQVQDRYAYVINELTSNFQIFDVSNPASVGAAVGSVAVSGTPFRLSVQGKYAYIVSSGGNTLNVYSIENPASPTLLGTIPTSGGPQGLVIVGRYAYVASSAGYLEVFDLGGGYVQQLEISGLQLDTGVVNRDLQINNQLDVRGGVNIAQGLGVWGTASFGAVNPAGGSATGAVLAGNLGAFDGSDTFRGLYLNYTNANHTGSSNIFKGIDIASITGDADATETALDIGSGWDYGISLAAGGTAALQLSSEAGTAVGGLLFGTDTTLYRSAANTLKTDDSLVIAGGLSVTGVASSGGGTNYALRIDSDGQVYRDTSSLRYKENLAGLAGDPRALLGLEPKSYQFIGRSAREIGLIAEEVDASGLSELVIYDEQGRPDGVRYEKLSLFLLQLTKQHEERLNRHESEIASLRLKVDALSENSSATALGAARELSLTATDSLEPTVPRLKIQGQEGSVQLVSTPTIRPGQDGQLLYLQGLSDYAVTLRSQTAELPTGLVLGQAERTVKRGTIMVLVYDVNDAVWYETSFTNSQ